VRVNPLVKLRASVIGLILALGVVATLSPADAASSCMVNGSGTCNFSCSVGQHVFVIVNGLGSATATCGGASASCTSILTGCSAQSANTVTVASSGSCTASGLLPGTSFWCGAD